MNSSLAAGGDIARESGDQSRSELWDRSAALFEAWQAGDPAAFDDLVRTLTPVLWQVVRAHGLQQATAEDVIQDTWLALTRSGANLRDPQAVGGWLLTSARRAAWRAAKTRVDPIDVEAAESHFGTAESAEQAAVLDDQTRRLWAAVATLSERCRRLIRIVAFDDRPDYHRTASELKMPVGSIGPTRRRCLEKLAAALGADHTAPGTGAQS